MKIDIAANTNPIGAGAIAPKAFSFSSGGGGGGGSTVAYVLQPANPMIANSASLAAPLICPKDLINNPPLPVTTTTPDLFLIQPAGGKKFLTLLSVAFAYTSPVSVPLINDHVDFVVTLLNAPDIILLSITTDGVGNVISSYHTYINSTAAAGLVPVRLSVTVRGRSVRVDNAVISLLEV
jgi:hypothetical protein